MGLKEPRRGRMSGMREGCEAEVRCYGGVGRMCLMHRIGTVHRHSCCWRVSCERGNAHRYRHQV